MWSVRVDEKLLSEAKPILKAKFGSDCRGVESWLAGLVATTKGEQLAGVYPSNTVEIGKLVIERNVRTRRKMVVDEETEVNTKASQLICEFPNCNRLADFVVFLRNIPGSGVKDEDLRGFYCRAHRKDVPRMIGYRPLSEVF